MTLHAVPTSRDHADEVHSLADRLGVSSEKLHRVEKERDRLRNFVVELRADHYDNGSGWCSGDHAAIFVPFPCEVREECDKALRPACSHCGNHTDLLPSGMCHACDGLLDDPLKVKCSRCGRMHWHDRDCVDDSFDRADHDDRDER